MANTQTPRYLLTIPLFLLFLGACSAESIAEGVAERAMEEAIEHSGEGGDANVDFGEDGVATIKIGDQTMTIDTENGGVQLDGFDTTGNDESFTIDASEGDDGEVTVEMSDGDSTLTSTTGTEIPDDWPSEFEIYDGAYELTANKTVTNDGTMWSATFDVDEAADELSAFYEDMFSDWEPNGSMDTSAAGDRTVFTTYARDGLISSVQVIESQGRDTHVAVVLMTNDI